jgi:predicted phage terminase large subunit-like protein
VLTVAERDVLRAEAKLALARRSSLEFNRQIDPDFDATARHTRSICEHLDALARREIENLAVFMPPQHGKSTFTAQRFPAYLLGISGGRALVATTSYTIAIARKNSRAARAIVRDRATWPFRNVELAPGAGSAEEWYTTAGGGVKAAGVGGSLTGFGANLIVVDDPFKGMAEADSPLMRDAAWEWWQTTVSTRARAGVQKLLCQTRWHDDDLAGRLLNTAAGKRWTILTLRSYAEEDDILGRPLGEVLWPAGPRPLSVADGEISSRAFAALYQQRPQPAEGAIFKAPWFEHRYDAAPSAVRAAMFIDGAWKTGLRNDRSAIGIWSTDAIDYHLRHVWAGRLEYPDLKAKVQDVYARFRDAFGCTLTVCVEDAASGIPLIQELSRTTSIPIVGVPVDKSKVVRAESISPLFESGKAKLPRAAEWLDEWIDEHLRFPTGTHDDQVDTTSGALARLAAPPSDFTWTSVSTARW